MPVSLGIPISLSFAMFLSPLLIFVLWMNKAIPQLHNSYSLLHVRFGLFIQQHWIELDPSHVSLCYVRYMAAGALRGWSLCGVPLVGLRVMSESEEPPPVRSSKLLAVFHGGIYPVEYTVEIPASGGFCSGAVRKGWIKDSGQFLDDDCPLRKNSVLQVRVYVLFLDINVMVFRKACAAAVETVGSQRRSHKNPFAIIRWQLQSPLRVKNCGRSGRLSPNLLDVDVQPADCNHSEPKSNQREVLLHHSSFDRFPEHSIGGKYRPAYFVPRTG